MVTAVVFLLSLLAVGAVAGVMARHPLFRGLIALGILVAAFVFSHIYDGAARRTQRGEIVRRGLDKSCEDVWVSVQRSAAERLEFDELILLSAGVCVAVMALAAPRPRV
jgi:hypothetical protein